MKNLLLIFTTLLILTQSLYSQSILDATIANSDSEQIITIDKNVRDIKTNLKNFAKTSTYNPDGPGERVVYKKGIELVQISLLNKDKEEDKSVTYYFRNNQMIYVQTLWTNRTTGTITKNERYYFNNEYLLAWFKFDKEVDVYSDEFKEAIEPLRKRAEVLRTDNLK